MREEFTESESCFKQTSDKLITSTLHLAELKNKLKGKLVVTNGCFDILHVGHTRYLKEAKALGDYLLVGINSDSSVKKIKGPHRPINKAEDRAEVLNALACVDFTFIFHEESADEFLKLAKPDIYVKGGDYDRNALPERDTLDQIKAEIIFVQFVNGYSSSAIVNKVKTI